MAEIDSRIALGVQPIQIADPLESYGKGLQLKALLDSSQLNQLKYQSAQNEVRDQESANAAWKNATGVDGNVDQSKLLGEFAQRNLGSRIPGIQKGFAETSKLGSDAQKSRLEASQKGLERLSSGAGYARQLIKNNQQHLIPGLYGELVRDGVMKQDEALQEMNSLPWHDPAALDKFFEGVQLKGVDALKQIELNTPKLEKVDNGQQITFQDVNPRTNPGGPQATKRFATPGELMADSRARAQQAQSERHFQTTQANTNSAVTYQQDQNGNLVALPTKAGPGPVAGRPVMGADGQPFQGNKQLTEFQGKSTGFALRAKEAHDILDSVGQGGKVQPGAIKRVAESVPFAGEGLGTALNFTQSPEQQRVEQAQRNFVNSILRQESGASISQGEFDNAKKQYFPQPGDDAKTIEQKKANRQTAIKGLEISAGPGISKAGATTQPKTAQSIHDQADAILRGSK